MWSYEFATDTDVKRAACWSALTAAHSGAAATPGGDRFELHGPVEVGTEVSVTPAGQDTFTSTIIELDPEVGYADRTEFGDVTLTFGYRFTDRPDGGTRIAHRLVIDGSGADRAGPELGAQITADFAEDLDQLIELARG